jgi:hypothetical protein
VNTFQNTQRSELPATLPGGLLRPRVLLGLVAALMAVGLWLGWERLAFSGSLPLLLSLAPCAAMCALGLCMHRLTGRGCADRASPATADSPQKSPEGG